eukprot:sb/3471307/
MEVTISTPFWDCDLDWRNTLSLPCQIHFSRPKPIHPLSGPLRQFLGGAISQLLAACGAQHDNSVQYPLQESSKEFQEIRFQGILITSLLLKHDPDLLSRNADLVAHFRAVWNSPVSQEKFRNPDKFEVPTHQWKEPKLLAECLLKHLERNPGDNELLFQLLHILDAVYVANKDFLHTHIKTKVVEG